MRRVTDRLILLWGAVVVALVLSVTLSGCGGANNIAPPISSPPPAASEDKYRPNYVPDVDRLLFWEQPVVTYRILTPLQTATDIQQQPIPCQWPTQGQLDSITEAFDKWSMALEGKREFVQVEAAESADIDVVVQGDDQFSQADQLGNTQIWVKNSKAGQLGRAVIRIRGKMDARQFRWTILHEAGHAIFASGHSRDLSDIMTARLPLLLPVAELSRRDINSIRVAYVDK